MSTIVIKTIKGRQYRYLQRSYREGGRVRTESVYLGPISGGRRRGVLGGLAELIAAQRAEPGTRAMNRLMEEGQKQAAEREKADRQAEHAFYAKMHALYGMVKGSANPIPIDKPATTIDLMSRAAAPLPAEASPNESPSAAEGAGATEAAMSE